MMRPVLLAAFAGAAFFLPLGAYADSWQTRSEISPIDDSENIYLSVMSDDPIEDRFGRAGHPVLWARCKENRTEVILEMATFEARDATMVTMRLDSEKAYGATWVRSSDGTALFYRGGSPLTLLDQLAKHHSIYLQWTPFDAPTYQARFDLDSLADILPDLQKACHWTAAQLKAKAAAPKPQPAAAPQPGPANESAEPNPPAVQKALDAMRAGQ